MCMTFIASKSSQRRIYATVTANKKKEKMTIKKIIIQITFILISINGFSQLDFTENPMQLKQKQIEENRAKHCVIKKVHYVFKADGKGQISNLKELRAQNEYNENGMSIISESFWPNEHLRNERTYNKWNKTIELKGFMNDQLQRRLVNEYDSIGNFLRTKYYFPNGQLKEIKENKIKGSISSDTEGNIKQSTEVEIDTLNRIYYSRLFDKEGNLQYENKYTVDKLNRITEWSVIDNIQLRKRKKNYSYDENGYTEEEFEYDRKGELVDKFISEYDDKKLEIKSSWYEKGILKQVSIYEYEFCKK